MRLVRGSSEGSVFALAYRFRLSGMARVGACVCGTGRSRPGRSPLRKACSLTLWPQSEIMSLLGLIVSEVWARGRPRTSKHRPLALLSEAHKGGKVHIFKGQIIGRQMSQERDSHSSLFASRKGHYSSLAHAHRKIKNKTCKTERGHVFATHANP